MMITKYCDFVLLVDKEKNNESDVGQLSVQVLQSPAGESPTPEIVSISSTLRPSTLQRSLRQLEMRYLDTKDIINLGEKLGNLLLPNLARKLFINSLKRLQPDEGLRLRLKLESSLASIPWEYLYIPVLSGGKRDSTGFCALHPKISLVRHELVSIAPQLNTLPKARRLLVALASPQDKESLDIAEERANIESALKDIPGIKAEFLENATAERLMEQLIPATDIFHFAGHGQFKRSPLDTSSGYIVLLGKDGNSASMSAEELVINVRDRGVQLVVLGACETGRRDEQNVRDGVVTALIEAGIPAAVAMQYKIWDKSAIAFSRSFYKALAAGLPLDQAVSAGRLAVFNLCNSLPDEQKQQYWRDWGVPVLYWRGEGNFILPAITDERQRQALVDELQAASDVAPVQSSSGGVNNSGTMRHSPITVVTGDNARTVSTHIGGSTYNSTITTAGADVTITTPQTSSSAIRPLFDSILAEVRCLPAHPEGKIDEIIKKVEAIRDEVARGQQANLSKLMHYLGYLTVIAPDIREKVVTTLERPHPSIADSVRLLAADARTWD